jgi:hypothetical protein
MHFPPIPLFCFLSVPSVRQQRGITDTFCVFKKKKTGPAGVFDCRQNVSFLFTFCPPAYLADLSDATDTNTFSLCVFVQPVSPSRQCNYALPSHPTLLFSFRAQRASATLQECKGY